MDVDRGSLPTVTLVRHGETEWSKNGRHTGRTDVPLTRTGERAAVELAPRLDGGFAMVFCSPSTRARETCRLAGFSDRAGIEPDLAEWDYGDYEGLTTAQIQAKRPGWTLFRDGCPGGENASDVGIRADRIIATIRKSEASALLFSSGHFLRVLTARWIGRPPEAGALLALDTASIGLLGYDHDRSEPVIHRWNWIQA